MTGHLEFTDRNSSAKILVSVVDIIEVTGDASGCTLQVNFHPTQRMIPVVEAYADVKLALAAAAIREDLGFGEVNNPGLGLRTGTSAPTLTAGFGGNAAIYENYFTGTGTALNIGYFSWHLPHSYKEGTNLKPHIHWTPTDTNAGNVKWQLEYAWTNRDTDVITTWATITVTAAASGVAWTHIESNFPEIVGTGKLIDSVLVCRIFRDPADGADTYAHDAAMLSVDFVFEMDTIGSATGDAK